MREPFVYFVTPADAALPDLIKIGYTNRFGCGPRKIEVLLEGEGK